MSKPKPRVALIGCVEFSRQIAVASLHSDQVDVVGMVSRSSSTVNTDFHSLLPIAEAADIPSYDAAGTSAAGMSTFLRSLEVDVALCVGWSKLLRTEVLRSTRLGVIGYHPAALPANRGRHPIIWALALGLRETASTFFLMDEGADTGGILDQQRVSITVDDDARSLYAKLLAAACQQLPRIFEQVGAGQLSSRPQSEAGNSWRKRSVHDGRIDWRMSFDAISALVRALSTPYPGAHFDWYDRQIIVYRALKGPPAFDNIEPGKVLAVEPGCLVVKCWGGTVRLLTQDFFPSPTIGDYL